MNQMTAAMLEMANMDELSRMDTFIHRRHPLGKLLVTILYIFVVVSFPVDNLSGLVPLILYPVLVFQLSGIPVSTCFYKLRFILPIVCAVGIWNPILDRTAVAQIGALTITSGLVSFITLMLKGVFALMASFLLIATTNIEKICYALSILHVPDLLVTQILITYRYISLLLHETGTMVNAYSLRAPGQKGLHFSAWGSFVGQLLLRSMDRATELFQSMKMRGFHGSFYYADVDKATKSDYLYICICSGLILAFRFVNISVLLGNLFV
ncbi:MAG: cobalt ECF transporter T component CbiQ [Coprococcus sp.]